MKNRIDIGNTMRALVFASGILLLTLAPTLAPAQRLADLNGTASVARHAAVEATPSTPNAALVPTGGAPRGPQPFRVATDGNRPKKWPYIVGGALIGATAAGVGFALYDSGDDAMFAPLVATVGITVSGIVGAGLGWLTYEIVHSEAASR